MKKAIPLLIFLLVLTASSCKHASSAQGNAEADASAEGTSFGNAVVIKEKTESSGVAAEYAWLKKHYPGYSLIKQTLVYHEGKPYDKMDIKTGDGKRMTVYFDISNFFGKF